MKATRRTRIARKHRASLPLQVFDQADECCRTIATLAVLLECCGSLRTPEMVDPKLLAHAGVMIARDVKRVQKIFARLQAALVIKHRKKQRRPAP